VITLRASTVESFRLYNDPDNDFISTEGMEERLRHQANDDREEDLTDRRDVGTALHDTVAGTYVGAALFCPDTVEKVRRGLGGVPSEVSGSVVVEVDGVKVRITGHADWLLGLDMMELKSSPKPIPPEKFADSMQWRCYVLIFGLKRIVYRLVHLDEDDDGVFYAKSVADVPMYPYPKLHEDVVECLRSLLAFAEARGCLDALEAA
jgi:hypothetical protein